MDGSPDSVSEKQLDELNIQSKRKSKLPRQEKVCIITGATNGIGKEAAMNLAEMGFTLGLVGRNPEKIDATYSSIQTKTGNKNIKFFQADLSLMSSVQRLAEKIKSTYNKIDVLLNNAGSILC
jgi:short-subunit dehydrogenase